MPCSNPLVPSYIVVFRIFCSLLYLYTPYFILRELFCTCACGQRAIHPRVAPACLPSALSGGHLLPSSPRCWHTPTRDRRVSIVYSPSTKTTTTTTATMAKQPHILPTNSSKTAPPRNIRGNLVVILSLLVGFQLYFLSTSFLSLFRRTEQLPFHAERSLARCASLRISAGPPLDFQDRTESDRFVHGTKATLFHNARIWTGENNGTEIVHGDVFFDKGIIQGVGNLNLSALRPHINGMIARGELNVVDVHGAWVTPGCVSPAFDSLLSTWYQPTIFLIGLSTHIPTLVMHPHLHLTAHQVMTTLSRGPSNHGFVR